MELGVVVERADIRLEKTCDAHPEQYDAYAGNKQVGYIRYMWGRLSVRCPDAEGVIVYTSYIGNNMHGSLPDDEREKILSGAIGAIALHLRGGV
jgi:hypothetical protein